MANIKKDFNLKALEEKYPLALALYQQLLSRQSFVDHLKSVDNIDRHGLHNLNVGQRILLTDSFEFLEENLSKIYKPKKS